ncbi:hypothetical protein AGRO_3588 [Agrobacterium sp. ATCC 31749]|nr:hypothetical protein AGRO_3588 [Agrobacterium sp. ATCC 31749]
MDRAGFKPAFFDARSRLPLRPLFWMT